MNQYSFSDLEVNVKKRVTRRGRFLRKIDNFAPRS